jgi:hypothetical protein
MFGIKNPYDLKTNWVAKMAKQIARLLKTDIMADIDIPAIAQFLQSQGRRGDTILAHINAKEAEMLRKMGGAEERNPVTGLPEYFSISDDYAYGADYGGSSSRARQVADAGFTPDYGSQQFPLMDSTQQANIRSSIDDYLATSPARENDFNYYASGSSQLPIDIETAPSRYAGQIQPNISGQPGLRMGGTDIGFDFGSRALAPDLTVPERASAATLGNAALDARMRADRELAGETTPGMMKRASAATGLSEQALTRLGLAGLGTVQGIMASRRASEQGREARSETEALARPYQQRGRELTQQAQEGQLTAQGQQQLQALRARLAQGAEARGGVGAAQTAAQVEAFRQNLLQNQFDYGQKISNIGDQLMLGAIRTGLEADRYAANLSNTYFTNMASIAAGMPASVPIQTGF